MGTCPWQREVIMRARDEDRSRLAAVGERTREGVPSLEGKMTLQRLAWSPRSRARLVKMPPRLRARPARGVDSETLQASRMNVDVDFVTVLDTALYGSLVSYLQLSIVKVSCPVLQ